MSYDRMGRRVTKNNQRFVYNGYLQIANFELETSNVKHQTTDKKYTEYWRFPYQTQYEFACFRSTVMVFSVPSA